MSNMEQKINALMRLVTAEDSESQAEARAEVLELLKQGEQQDTPKSNLKAETEIRAMLTNLGMPEHIKGHRYTAEAIRQCVEAPELIEAMTKELYPNVAKAFQTTASRTERAIRHAIELCWDRCDISTLQNYFGNTISPSKGKPTNSEFIARVSNIVRERMEGAA